MGRKTKTIIATDNCISCGCDNSVGYVIGKDGRLYGSCKCGHKQSYNLPKSAEIIKNCKDCGIDVENIFYQENNFHYTF